MYVFVCNCFSLSLIRQIPVINIQMKIIPALCTFIAMVFSCTNYFRVIFTGGVGKNGSTIAVRTPPLVYNTHICYYIIYIVSLSTINTCVFQGTSVLSPVLHIGSVIVLAMMIYKKSAVQLFQKHPCLYILAFGFVSAKITNKLVVSKDARRHGLRF